MLGFMVGHHFDLWHVAPPAAPLLCTLSLLIFDRERLGVPPWRHGRRDS
jgi:hypothetical protein